MVQVKPQSFYVNIRGVRYKTGATDYRMTNETRITETPCFVLCALLFEHRQAEEQRAREDHLTKERLRHPPGRGGVLLRSIGGLLRLSLRVGLLGRVGAVNVHCVHDAVQVVLPEFAHPARQLDLHLVTGPTKWQHSVRKVVVVSDDVMM